MLQAVRTVRTLRIICVLIMYHVFTLSYCITLFYADDIDLLNFLPPSLLPALPLFFFLHLILSSLSSSPVSPHLSLPYPSSLISLRFLLSFFTLPHVSSYPTSLPSILLPSLLFPPLLYKGMGITVRMIPASHSH